MFVRPGSLICGIALIFVAISSVAAGEETTLERDVWGYFRPAKRPPAAFANIAELHLAGRSEYGWKASPPYFGMIKTAGKNGVSYRLREPVITGLQIEFSTEIVARISYQFSGTLARADFSGGGIPMDEVMLRGTIRKLKDGKEIAAGELAFFFETGG